MGAGVSGGAQRELPWELQAGTRHRLCQGRSSVIGAQAPFLLTLQVLLQKHGEVPSGLTKPLWREGLLRASLSSGERTPVEALAPTPPFPPGFS